MIKHLRTKFIRIAMLNPIANTVLNVSFQDNLTGPMQGGFCCVDLGEDVFTGHILIDHPVDGLNLAYNFFQTAVQIIRVHALPHSDTSILLGVYVYNTVLLPCCQSIFQMV